MSESSVVAHQFDDAEQQRDAATLGMWIFLITEILFFGGLFTAYTVYRSAFPGPFGDASNHLDIVLGAINTAVLIGSSFTMATAVHGAQTNHRRMLMIGLALTILLGLVFLGIKGVEYEHKFHQGLFPGAAFSYEGGEPGKVRLFFSLYFAMTGLHAAHMVIGVGILAVLLVGGARGRFGGNYYTPVEVAGLYWHFVDIVWIFLFPLLYLVARH